MRLLPLLLGSALLIPVASATAQVAPATSEQMIQRERSMWQYVKDHNLVPFRAAVDSTMYTSISRYGVHGMPLDATRYEWTNLDRYELSDFEARGDSVTVLLTYKAELTGTSLGNRVSGTWWMATIWRLKDGQWLAVFHSESKV
jgi:hypothetical protein